MNIYKIENRKAITGKLLDIVSQETATDEDGTKTINEVTAPPTLPDGFTAYEIGKEPQELLDAINNDVSVKVAEAQSYLNSTDHKMFSDYEPKSGEDLDAIKTQRKTYRDFIRANKQ